VGILCYKIKHAVPASLVITAKVTRGYAHHQSLRYVLAHSALSWLNAVISKATLLYIITYVKQDNLLGQDDNRKKRAGDHKKPHAMQISEAPTLLDEPSRNVMKTMQQMTPKGLRESLQYIAEARKESRAEQSMQ
jgi:hypothetical protein